MQRIFSAAVVAALVFTTACDNGPKAVASRDDGYRDPPIRSSRPYVQRASAGDRSTSQSGGSFGWAANKAHSADENAQFQFDRNGADFGSRSVADYVAKAKAFADQPPSGADTVTRKNGDRLIYDAKANTFAVVARDGAPRTLFKPKTGPAYWQEQKAKAEQQASTRAGDSQG
jgi:hypothetical protein